MKVKALRKFKDIKENKIRKTGETFEVNQKRFEEINSTKYGILVEEVNEKVIEEVKETIKKEGKKKK